MENLARGTCPPWRIIRASFSQERMTYHHEIGQVEYQSKDEKETRVFDSLEWLAAMCSHVPNKGEQMARYGACPPSAELLQQCVARKTEKSRC